MALPAPDELHAWLAARWEDTPLLAERTTIYADPFTLHHLLRGPTASLDGSIRFDYDRDHPSWRGIPIQTLLPKGREYDYEVHHLLRWRYWYQPAYRPVDLVNPYAVRHPGDDIVVIDAPFTHEVYKQGANHA